MANRKRNTGQETDLRRRAEEHLRARPPGASAEEIDALALVHELQVHQAELEISNEELRQSRAELEDLVRKYSDLYNFAPIGYLTLTPKGVITEINLAGATMLGVNRSQLVGTAIWRYVYQDGSPAMRRFLNRLVDQEGKLTTELVLLKAGKEPFDALIEGVCFKGSSGDCVCRLAATDITPRKRAERDLQIAYSQQEALVRERTRELSEANAALAISGAAAEARADHEHYVAYLLQQALMPSQTEFSIHGCEVAACYKPASKETEVGGDFFDVFELPDGMVGVVIGDVIGKGVPAAARAVAARHVIRSYAYLDPSPSVVMTLANRTICRTEMESFDGMLTAAYLTVDARSRTLTCVNGGHEPAMLRRGDGSITELKCEGSVVGVNPDLVYVEHSRRLEPTDTLIMVTDGITEARVPGSDILGKEALVDFISTQPRGISGQELIQSIVEVAEAHADGVLQDDAIVLTLSLP